MSIKKINSIQLLRAIAVSLVIFIHAATFGVVRISSINPVEGIYNSQTWGAIGVDLFFCISGFIMTIVVPSYQEKNDWKKFQLKRVIRILPLYYLLSALDALATVFIKHQELDLIAILKTIFFFPFFDSEKISSPLISVGWSLSYEIYFYLLVSFFLVYKINTLKALLVTICTLCTLGVLINPSIAMLRFLTNPILLEFALGISCGLIYSWLSSSKITNSKKSYISMALMLIGFILMSITFFVSTNNNIHAFDVIENDSHLAFYRSIVWGIPCAVFMLGVILVEKSFMVKIPKILILAGDASYSNYLIHGQVYVIIAIIYRSLHLNSVTYLITVIPICIVVSIIFFKIIERPLNSTVDNLINYKRKA